MFSRYHYHTTSETFVRRTDTCGSSSLSGAWVVWWCRRWRRGSRALFHSRPGACKSQPQQRPRQWRPQGCQRTTGASTL